MALEDLRANLAEINIAENLSASQLEEIAKKVIEGYDADLISRSEWENNYAKSLELAMQVAKDKTFPWPKAANIKYPLLTTASLQFSSRAYPALVPGYNIVRGRAVGQDSSGEKTEKAIRVGKHMSFQLLEEMEDWEEDMDKLCMLIPIIGCAFKKTYYSQVKGTNVSELVMPSHLVVNYSAKSLEDAYRKTHVLELAANQIKERTLAGVYLDVDLGEPKAQPQNVITEAKDGIHGITPQNTIDGSTTYKILEQHTFLDLDNDGYEEPYIITVDYETKQVLRISARFDMDGVTLDQTGEKIIRIAPVEYFTKYSFIPAPDGGFYDIGFGTLLGPINGTINSAINQLLDAGTLSNLQSGFLARGIRLKGGQHKMSPGQWTVVNSTSDDLRKGIVPMPVREPSNVLFSLLGLMISAGKELSSTTDPMIGENPGQNQKATTTLAVLEQGMKVFNGIYKRMYRAQKKEFKKLYRLNSLYLEEEQYFTVLDPESERGEVIKQEDYSLDTVDIVPAADPNVATEQQKLAKASGLLELLQLGLISNPQEVAKRILDAQEQPGVEALLTPPGPPPPDPELLKMQDESKRAWALIDIEKEKLRMAAITAKANAMLAMAKAEATESGTQVDLYKTQVDSINKEADRALKELEVKTSNRGEESNDDSGNNES
jgi:chaperonin GroES